MDIRNVKICTFSFDFFKVPGGAPGANGGSESAIGGGGKRLGPAKFIAAGVGIAGI